MEDGGKGGRVEEGRVEDWERVGFAIIDLGG